MEEVGIPIEFYDHRTPVIVVRRGTVCVYVECLHAMWLLGECLSAARGSRLFPSNSTGRRLRDQSSFPAPSPTHLKSLRVFPGRCALAPSRRSSNGSHFPEFWPLRSCPIPSFLGTCGSSVQMKFGWRRMAPVHHIASRSCVMEWNHKSFTIIVSDALLPNRSGYEALEDEAGLVCTFVAEKGPLFTNFPKPPFRRTERIARLAPRTASEVFVVESNTRGNISIPAGCARGC